MHRKKMDVLTVAWIQDLCSENKKLKRNLETAESSVETSSLAVKIMDYDNKRLKRQNEYFSQEVKSLNMKIRTLTKSDSGGGGDDLGSSTSTSDSSSSDDDDDIRSPPRKCLRVEVDRSDSSDSKRHKLGWRKAYINRNRSFPTKMQTINRKLTKSQKQQERVEVEHDEGTSLSESDGIRTGSSDEDENVTARALAAASPPKRIVNRSEIVMKKLKANIQKEKELDESMTRFSSVNRKSDSSSLASLVEYASSNEDEDIIIIPESENENEVLESSISVIQLDTTSDSDNHTSTSSESEHEYGKYNKSLASKLVKSYQTHVSGNGKRPMMSKAESECLIINEVRGQRQRPTTTPTPPTLGASSHNTHDDGQTNSSSSTSVRVEKPESESQKNKKDLMKASKKNKGNANGVTANFERRVTRSSVKDIVAVTYNSTNLRKSTSSTSDSEEDADEIGKILDVRQEKNGECEFLIQWKGRDAKDATWEAEGELEGAEDIIKEFYENFKAGRGRGRKIDQSDRIQLWCTCRQPHDNRFMICCDRCEEWFHGKCVGVTKTQGKVFETMKTTWHCPSCKQIIKVKADADFNKMVKVRASFGGGARASTSASAPKKNWGIKSNNNAKSTR